MIELNINNLYTTGRIVQYEDATLELIREKLEFDDSSTNQYHILTKFDTLDSLAYLYWGSLVEDASKFWWVIADINNIDNPLDLTDYIGKRLAIPDIQRILLLI